MWEQMPSVLELCDELGRRAFCEA
ncbi:hypothetical protein RA210_U290019 [Rubrivivax sp. A210]|nr:hypothetical protein RA210_U290019 [Rubrivivax sp. A210]